jgi:hypothetical protein
MPADGIEVLAARVTTAAGGIGLSFEVKGDVDRQRSEARRMARARLLVGFRHRLDPTYDVTPAGDRAPMRWTCQ